MSVSVPATRASRAPSLIQSPCVYNVPMALNDSLEHTRGLEPHHAKSRNLHYVDSSKSFILGPMPTGLFLKKFLPLDGAMNTKPLATVEKAFDAVPQRAATVAEILEPLVRLIIGLPKA